MRVNNQAVILIFYPGIALESGPHAKEAAMGTATACRWQERWREQMVDMAARSDTPYWNRRAADYDDFITTSRFDYGGRMAELLAAEGMLAPHSSVLEIASGVGAVTLPLARLAGRVTAVEPARSMADLLAKNAATAGLDNLDVAVEDFASFAAQAPDASYDMVFLCHAAWQFPDIAKLIQEMSRLSRGWCCLADTMGQGDAEHREMQQKLAIDTPTLDRSLYLYNVLSEMGLPASLAPVRHVMRRSADSARSMWTNLVSKYRDVSAGDEQIIDEFVAARSTGGVYETPGAMALMWWRVQ
jgi:predicted O-methyltransferase YrrM